MNAGPFIALLVVFVLFVGYISYYISYLQSQINELKRDVRILDDKKWKKEITNVIYTA